MNRQLLTSACFLSLISGASQAAELAPHRAFYDITLQRVDKGQNINTIVGKLAYEITGSSCEGYAVNYRVANRISYTEGGTQVVDMQMNAFESPDGLELNLKQKQFIDAKSIEDADIKVKKDSLTAIGKGAIKGTDNKVFDLDATAVFPTAFQSLLIDVAQKGETRNQSLVYEGSEKEKPLKVISFIGVKKPTATLQSTGEVLDVSNMATWPVSISYYNVESAGDEEPVYQANFQMLENGISTDLVMNYGAYSLEGKLSKLEILKAEKCN